MTVSGFDKSPPRMAVKVALAKLRNDTFYKMADGRTMILSPSNSGGMKWTYDKSHVLSKDLTEGYYLKKNNATGFHNIGTEWQQAALNLEQSGYLTPARKESNTSNLPINIISSTIAD